MGGLARFGGLFGGDLARAIEHVLVEPALVEREREGRGDVHRKLLAERLEHVDPGIALERDEHADLAEAGACALWTYGITAPCETSRRLARRSDWFSPVVPKLLVRPLAAVVPEGIFSAFTP